MHSRIVLVWIFICLSAVGFSQSLDFTRQIDWDPVEGAAAYIFVLQKDGITIVEEKVEKNFIILTLFPGSYQFKVIVLNKFQKKAAETPWQNLTVKVALKPIIKSVSANKIYTGIGDFKFKAVINNMQEESKIFLADESDSRIIEAKWTRLDNGDIQISFDTSGEFDYEKSYSLLVEDPSGLFSISRGIFVLEKALQPEVESLSQNSGYISETYRGVSILGKNFKDGAQVLLRNEFYTIRADYTKKVSELNLSVDFNLRFANSGVYDLVVINPSGLESVLAKAFTVNSYVISNIFEISFNYVFANMRLDKRVTAPEGDTGLARGDKFFHSVTGFGMTADFGFGNKVFHDKPFVKDLGVQLDFLFSFFLNDTIYGEETATYNPFLFGMIGANLFYKTQLDIPLDFSFKAGFGVCILNMKLGDTPFLDDYTGYQTAVPYFNFGADMIIRTKKKVFFNFGVGVRPLFYPNNRIDLVITSFAGLGVSIK
ncbi:MAG: hypothetical protein JXR63_02545 [Spirochaetales bacterium]|nr:hypothetical protein [Spirochaetales bacterium]